MLPLDEDACRKRLTTYEAFSIRKVLPPSQKKDKDKKDKSNEDTKDRSTWAKSEHTRESWTQEEIVKQIKMLNESHSVTERKQKLRHFQQSQVNSVLEGLKAAEYDDNFEWSLAQINQKFQPVGRQKETTVITVYAKRSPRRDVNAVDLYRFFEKCRDDKMANRPAHQETMKRVLGAENPSTLTSMASLASTYRNQGRCKEAEELEVQIVDPLSIGAGVVGIIVLALHGSQLLLDDIQCIIDAPKSIKTLETNLKSIQMALTLLQAVKDAEWELLGDAVLQQSQATIRTCTDTCKLFHTDLQRWTKHYDRGQILWKDRANIGFLKQRRIKAISVQLQTCQISINSVVGIAALCVALYYNIKTIINTNTTV